MRVVSSVLDSQNWVVVLVSHLVDYEFSKGGTVPGRQGRQKIIPKKNAE